MEIYIYIYILFVRVLSKKVKRVQIFCCSFLIFVALKIKTNLFFFQGDNELLYTTKKNRPKQASAFIFTLKVKKKYSQVIFYIYICQVYLTNRQLASYLAIYQARVGVCVCVQIGFASNLTSIGMMMKERSFDFSKVNRVFV